MCPIKFVSLQGLQTYFILAKYQGVAPGFNGWEITTYLKNIEIWNNCVIFYLRPIICEKAQSDKLMH